MMWPWQAYSEAKRLKELSLRIVEELREEKELHEAVLQVKNQRHSEEVAKLAYNLEADKRQIQELQEVAGDIRKIVAHEFRRNYIYDPDKQRYMLQLAIIPDKMAYLGKPSMEHVAREVAYQVEQEIRICRFLRPSDTCRTEPFDALKGVPKL